VVIKRLEKMIKIELVKDYLNTFMKENLREKPD